MKAALGDVLLWRQFDHLPTSDLARDKETVTRSDASRKISAVVETTFLFWIGRIKRCPQSLSRLTIGRD